MNNTNATSYPSSWRQCPNCGEWYDTIFSSSDPNYKVHTCQETKEVCKCPTDQRVDCGVSGFCPCKCHTPTPNKNIECWEEEFDKKMEGWKFHHKTTPCCNDTYAVNEVKDFIRNLLQVQREELEHKIRTMFTKEEVEGMKAGWVKEIEGLDENKAFEASGAIDYDFLDGFSEAKKAVITLINSLK
jgi:hypothetical protein